MGTLFLLDICAQSSPTATGNAWAKSKWPTCHSTVPMTNTYMRYEWTAYTFDLKWMNVA